MLKCTEKGHNVFLNAFVVTLDLKASECCSSSLRLKMAKWQNIKHGEGLKELSLQELLYHKFWVRVRLYLLILFCLYLLQWAKLKSISDHQSIDKIRGGHDVLNVIFSFSNFKCFHLTGKPCGASLSSSVCWTCIKNKVVLCYSNWLCIPKLVKHL